MCNAVITQQLVKELSLLSVASRDCTLHTVQEFSVLCCSFSQSFWRGEDSQLDVITNSVLVSPGTIKSVLAGHCWGRKAGCSREATTADDNFPFTPKNPTHKKGFVGTIWLFFFFPPNELSFYSIWNIWLFPSSSACLDLVFCNQLM